MNFRVMAVRDIRAFVIFSPFRSQSIRKSAYENGCLFSRLDSQSQFQMFTLFSGRNVGVPRRYINAAQNTAAV